jgi:hypothetical protein
MKDDVNDKVPNGTPKTIIPSNGMVNGCWNQVIGQKVTMLHIYEIG